MQLLLIYHMEVFETNLTVYLQRHLQLKKKRRRYQHVVSNLSLVLQYNDCQNICITNVKTCHRMGHLYFCVLQVTIWSLFEFYPQTK